MNYSEFIGELERLLEGIPEEERRAAVQYYMDYFADAGEANEADVIRELGSPQKVAESIKAEYYGTRFDENKYEKKDYAEKYPGNGGGSQEQESSGRPRTDNRIKLLLIVLIAIVLWPVTLGIGSTLLGIAAAVVCFFAGLVVAAVSVMISGIIIFVAGLVLIAVPPAAFIVMGTGVLIFVLGLAGTAITAKICIIVYPAMIRGFVNLCRRPFYGKAVS